MSTVDTILIVFSLYFFNRNLLDPNYRVHCNGLGQYFGSSLNSLVYFTTAFTSLQKSMRSILQMENWMAGVKLLFRQVRSKNLQPIYVLMTLEWLEIYQLKKRSFEKFCSQTFSWRWKTVRKPSLSGSQNSRVVTYCNIFKENV